MANEEAMKRARHLRANIVRMLTKAGSGHPGGSLSIIDILNVLYFEEMNIDPKNPKMEDRDRFVLSKGHAAPALYAVLAAKKAIFRKKNSGSSGRRAQSSRGIRT